MGRSHDGRYLKLYDTPVPNVTPENRLVVELDLARYSHREDFEVAIYPDLALLSGDRVAVGTDLLISSAELAGVASSPNDNRLTVDCVA